MVTAEQSQILTPNPELYLLGHSYDEERRLKKQAEELRQESARMFDRIGIEKGSRAIDLGCGPQGVLDLLSERVGRPAKWSVSNATGGLLPKRNASLPIER